MRIVVDSPAPRTALQERLLALAGTVDDLPADMSRNHADYIHGAPKEPQLTSST